jgi:hypothetical protein
MTNNKLEQDILAGLKKYGRQLTTTLTYCFGKGFGPAIRSLHAQGLVRQAPNGWEAV